mmetsp:Transcript_85628/g.247156  ORF Transcript_85628/g.247156 Transcript_85628/m.247156 type:complete len:207 (-) Transcript_85628:1310-1930(-)
MRGKPPAPLLLLMSGMSLLHMSRVTFCNTRHCNVARASPWSCSRTSSAAAPRAKAARSSSVAALCSSPEKSAATSAASRAKSRGAKPLVFKAEGRSMAAKVASKALVFGAARAEATVEDAFRSGGGGASNPKAPPSTPTTPPSAAARSREALNCTARPARPLAKSTRSCSPTKFQRNLKKDRAPTLGFKCCVSVMLVAFAPAGEIS